MKDLEWQKWNLYLFVEIPLPKGQVHNDSVAEGQPGQIGDDISTI